MKRFWFWLRHQIIIYLTCPTCNSLVEFSCPHKGKFGCRIWTCTAHYDLCDGYLKQCRYYVPETIVRDTISD